MLVFMLVPHPPSSSTDAFGPVNMIPAFLEGRVMEASVAPSTLPALLDFPFHTLAAIQAAEKRGELQSGVFDQFIAWLDSGVVEVSACFSGIGGWEIALHLLDEAARQSGFRRTDASAFKINAACDKKKSAQLLLLQLSGTPRPQHIFEDVCDRMSRSAREVVERTEAEFLNQGLDGLFDELMNFLTTIGPQRLFENRRARCIVHKQECACSQRAGPAHVRIHCASNICKDVSFMNQRRPGNDGKTAKALAVWICERQYHQEDLIVTECTAKFDVNTFHQTLGHWYHVHTLCVGPEHLGWWTNRRRRFCILAHKQGALQLHAPWEKFFATFGRGRPAESEQGGMFYAAPADLVNDRIGKQARRRRKAAEIGDLAMTGTQDAMRQLYECLYLESVGHDRAELMKLSRRELSHLTRIELESRGRDVIVDLEQTPNRCRGMTPAVPVLLAKHNIYSFRKRRSLLPEEALLSHGFHMLDVNSHFYSPWDASISDLPVTPAKDLVGNTVNLHVVSSLLAFIFAHAKQRTQNLDKGPHVVIRKSEERERSRSCGSRTGGLQ